MTWLLRSMDQSFRASAERRACPAGIIFEPGSPACWATRSMSQAHQVRKEQEQPAAHRLEGTLRQSESPRVGRRLRLRPLFGRALLVQATGERREPLFPQDLTNGRGAQVELSLFERLADFVHGIVLLSEAPPPDRAPGPCGTRGGVRPGAVGEKKSGRAVRRKA